MQRAHQRAAASNGNGHAPSVLPERQPIVLDERKELPAPLLRELAAVLAAQQQTRTLLLAYVVGLGYDPDTVAVNVEIPAARIRIRRQPPEEEVAHGNG